MIPLLLIAAIGGIFVAMTVTLGLRIRLIRRTPTIPCADLATRAKLPGGEQLEIAGIAEPGPGGPLRAPLSGEPCVWYGVRAVPRSKPFGRVGRPIRMPRGMTSEEAFGVRDASGLACVAPAGVEVQSGRLQVNESEDGPPFGYAPAPESLAARAWHVLGPPDEGAHWRFRFQEWIVPIGSPVYVLGAPVTDDAGNMVLGFGPGRFVIGAGHEAEVVRSLRRKALALLGIGLLFLVPSLAIAILGVIGIVTDSAG